MILQIQMNLLDRVKCKCCINFPVNNLYIVYFKIQPIFEVSFFRYAIFFLLDAFQNQMRCFKSNLLRNYGRNEDWSVQISIYLLTLHSAHCTDVYQEEVGLDSQMDFPSFDCSISFQINRFFLFPIALSFIFSFSLFFSLLLHNRYFTTGFCLAMCSNMHEYQLMIHLV